MIYTLSIRTFASHEWRTYRDLRLRALADSPDTFGRTLAAEEGRPNTEWSSRLASGVDSRLDLPLLAVVDSEPTGLAWGRIESSNLDVANLYQMWVAPNYRGHGVGQMLLKAVIDWAKAANVCYLALGVTCGDNPALRLYLRAGFKPIGEPEPLRPGSELLAHAMRLPLRTAGGSESSFTVLRGNVEFLGFPKDKITMAWAYRLGLWRRLVNRIVRVLLRLGVNPPQTYLLTVRGRKSGHPYSTPVTLVEKDRQRWLVAPYGEVGWVRNARAAKQVTLTRGRRSETVAILELSAEDAAPVLKTYLAQVPVVRPFFDVTPKSNLRDFVLEAPRHPVFRIR